MKIASAAQATHPSETAARPSFQRLPMVNWDIANVSWQRIVSARAQYME